jgi:hypothetical protein
MSIATAVLLLGQYGSLRLTEGFDTAALKDAKALLDELGRDPKQAPAQSAGLKDR